MTLSGVVRNDGGLAFEDGDDHGRVIVSAAMSGGEYSVLEYVVAPWTDVTNPNNGFGVHRHGTFEETFLIRAGELEFMIGDEVVTLACGDFVRVPRATRHGYRNMTAEPVGLIVTFVPGGFEELFVKYRTDGPTVDGPGFVIEATTLFDSDYS